MSIENHLISVIVVTYNSSKYIEKCLKSIIEYWPSNYQRKIILIDNNSSDRTLEKVRQFRKGSVSVYCRKKNYGFAKSVNLGLKTSQESKYFLLVNPDTEVKKGSIGNMVSEIDKHNAGICGGMTVGFDGEKLGDHFRKIDINIGLFDFSNLRRLAQDDRWHKYFYYDEGKTGNATIEVDGVTGGYMMIEAKTIKEIGYLDENFYMYLEDMDYCLRARKSGLKIIYTPKSIIRHYGGGSSENKTRSNSLAWIHSRSYFFYKHFGLFTNLIIQPVFLLDSLFILLKDYILLI